MATEATFDLNNFTQSIGSLAGAGSVTLGTATLTTGNDNTITDFSGVINGLGGLTKVGAGTQILSGDNTYTGGTTISAGTLQLGNGGTSGSIVGDVVDNGTFAINHSDPFTFGGVISGSGSLHSSAPGPPSSPPPIPILVARRSALARCSSATAARAARSWAMW